MNIRALRTRPVLVPFRRPPVSASGAIPKAALVLFDLETDQGVTDPGTLRKYYAAWDHAADRTPHGTPIELKPEDFR